MEITENERKALKLVHDRGMTDMREHLAVLRNDERIYMIDGDGDHVNIEHEMRQGVFKPGDVFIHNHPNLGSLSNMDLGVAVQLRAGAIFAIARDGSIYRASKFRTLSFWGFHDLMEDFEALYHDRKLSAHAINMRLSEIGYFKYEYELGGLNEEAK